MRVSLLKDGQAEGVVLDTPFDGGGVFPVPLRLLPGSGRYLWRAVVIDPNYGQICERSGALTRARPVYF